MLTAEGCQRRRQRLWNALPEKPDWLIVADPEHQIYLANYEQSPFEFRSNDAGAILLLHRNGSTVLVADNIVAPYAEKAFVDEVVAPVWYEGKASAPRRETLLVKSGLDRLKKEPGAAFGVELSAVPAGILEGLRDRHSHARVIDLDPFIHPLRRQKDADEIALMRRSIAAGEAGFAAALAGIKPGMTELEAFQLVQHASIEAAGEPVRIYGDFASGPRTMHGGAPTARVIEKGDLFLLDYSVIVRGYRGDFANTFVVAGKPSEMQRKHYEGCMASMRAAEELLAPGRSCRDVDKAARDALAKHGLDVNHGHHIGHGLGLGHPEAPFIVPESSETLMPGDVVTIEPGQYAKEVSGMRFEHNYLITENGFERLTHHALTLEQPS